MVYADAKVRNGQRYLDRATGELKQSKIGETTVAYVGFVGTEAKPIVRDSIPLSRRMGPNEAEYLAILHGLANAVSVVAEQESFTHVLVCSDSAIAIDTLTGRKAAHELAPLRAQVRWLEDYLATWDVQVNYEYVPRSNTRHLQAHQLSQAIKHRPAG